MTILRTLKQTLHELDDYLADPVVTNRDRAGVIQAFEFTFEQAWKAIQRRGAELGNPNIGSPKSALVFALANQWIDRSAEGLWLQMLKDRNLTTHTYQEDLAKLVLQRIEEHYSDMFHALIAKIELS